MQESRAVISWEDGAIRSTEWLADDGSQAVVDQMVDGVAALLNQRSGEKCAIKWERREVRGGVLGKTARSGSPVEAGSSSFAGMVGHPWI
jgi:hypothetical protein